MSIVLMSLIPFQEPIRHMSGKARLKYSAHTATQSFMKSFPMAYAITFGETKVEKSRA